MSESEYKRRPPRLHICTVCGGLGTHGKGWSSLKNTEGRWWCGRHLPPDFYGEPGRADEPKIEPKPKPEPKPAAEKPIGGLFD